MDSFYYPIRQLVSSFKVNHYFDWLVLSDSEQTDEEKKDSWDFEEFMIKQHIKEIRDLPSSQKHGMYLTNSSFNAECTVSKSKDVLNEENKNFVREQISTLKKVISEWIEMCLSEEIKTSSRQRTENYSELYEFIFFG